METCFNYCDGKAAFFSSDERKWITKMHKLQATHPDEVTILKEPQNNDGCIYVRLPASYLKVQPKFHREITDEQKRAAAERLKNRLKHD